MKWEPARADHSIDRAVVSIRLRSALDPNDFDELVVAARKAAAKFQLAHRVETIDPIEISTIDDADPQNLVPQALKIGNLPNASPRRVHFQRLDTGGVVADEFSLGRERIAFATTRYRRWENFFHLIKGTMDDIINVCASAREVRAIRLEYLDRFISAPGGADHFEVLSRNSEYLVPVVKDKGAALHVHSGWFDFEAAGVRCLTNVNIDVRDIGTPPPADPRRRIAVLTMSEHEALGGLLDDPMRRVDEMHTYLKSIYGSILTPEAAHRVALDK